MGEKLYLTLHRLYNSKQLPWIIIGIGIILRLARFMHNTPLYFDEAGSAVDIISRPLSDLINPSPDAVSSYPVTFILINKFAINFFGNSEYAFRLYPLILGIAALFLFYYVARHYINPKAVPAALMLFALMDPLVYYSSIVKPYSGDVFFTLLLFAVLCYVQSKQFRPILLVILAITGGLTVWFSNPAVFVLAGIGTCLIVFTLNTKEWRRASSFICVCFVWALSFIIHYTAFIRVFMASIGSGVNEVIKAENAFFPFPPTSLGDIKWFIDTFFETFNFLHSFNFQPAIGLSGIAALLFICGSISMLTSHKRNYLTIMSPVLFTLGAAALHMYPFKGRLILFLVPFFLLVICEGIIFMHEQAKSKSNAIVAIITAILFIYPLSQAAHHMKQPISRGEVRPVLKHIKDNWQNGDIIYVHFYAQYEFEFYSRDYPAPSTFDEDEYIIGIAPRGWYRNWKRQDTTKYFGTDKMFTQSSSDILNSYIEDLKKVQGHKRVWLLFADNISSTRGINDTKFFLYTLDAKGTQVGSFNSGEIASTYLYELGGT